MVKLFVNLQTIHEKRVKYSLGINNYKFQDEYGDLSAKIFIQGDCSKLRFKWLKLSYHKDQWEEIW